MEIAVSAARDRGTPDPEGHALTVHDTVLQAKRRAVRDGHPQGRTPSMLRQAFGPSPTVTPSFDLPGVVDWEPLFNFLVADGVVAAGLGASAGGWEPAVEASLAFEEHPGVAS